MTAMSRALLAIVMVVMLPMISPGAQTATQATAVHVVTYVDIAQGQISKARQALLKYRDASSKSPGSTGIELLQEIGRPGRIVVRETWADQKAFDAHGKSVNASTLEQALKAMRIAPADQRIHLNFASGAGPGKASTRAVYVISHVDVPPPRQAEIEPLLRSVQAASVTAAGSVRFDVLQQSTRKNHFTVAETWTSLKAVDAQAVASAQREFRDKLGPMLGALYDQRYYRALK